MMRSRRLAGLIVVLVCLIWAATGHADMVTRTLENLFGNSITFTVFSTPANATKTYEHFSDVADDVVNARIYQGIHFRAADVLARKQGTAAADWAFANFLRLYQ